jgi:hypothetical protein
VANRQGNVRDEGVPMESDFIIRRVEDAGRTGDTWDFRPMFTVERAGELVFSVACGLSRPGEMQARFQLGIADDGPLRRLLLRWAVRRLESVLGSADQVEALRSEGHANWMLTSYELDDLLALGLAKHCDYQHIEVRDLYCLAAAPNERQS